MKKKVILGTIVGVIAIILLIVSLVLFNKKDEEPEFGWKVEKNTETVGCDDVVMTILETEGVRYTVSNACYLYETIIVLENGEKYLLEEVIKREIIPIDELIEGGVKITKEEREVNEEYDWDIISEMNDDLVCIQVVTLLYDDNGTKYYVGNPCIIEYTYIVFHNGEKYNIKDALEQGKVKIKDIKNRGFNVFVGEY